jgi:hypothetical protein
MEIFLAVLAAFSTVLGYELGYKQGLRHGRVREY